jgi:hypothetical protein
MCSRESCSVLPTRFLGGVFVFLTAFLLGFAAVAIVDLVRHSVLSATEQEHLFANVETPRTPPAGVNDDGPIAVEYLYTKGFSDRFVAVFRLTNYGSESITFGDRFRDSSYFCRLHEGRLTGTVRVGSVGCRMEDSMLAPDQSTMVEVPVEFDDISYLLTLKYSVGPDFTTKDSHLVVANPHLRKY